MNIGFYPKLAWNGISKNKKLYLPYLLTCSGMVMIFYIFAFLSKNNSTAMMRGGEILQLVLQLGSFVIGAFSLIFLFYTNSFLIRRRQKEFGLYNILGMGKRNLALILIWETAIVAAASLAVGLGCGNLFSTAAELCLMRLIGINTTFSFSVNMEAMIGCLILFGVIFALILLNSLRKVYISRPVELLRSDTVGEKPPKGNALLAVLGAVLLAAAYYIAIKIDDPVSSLLYFFVLVLMVIVATYMLFIAGSVTFCRLLQKNKRYYYKTNHFISVSSMVYRMKRNGAGLASICILSTMVLVMLSATSCLYIGTEDSLKQMYPRQIGITVKSEEGNLRKELEDQTREILSRNQTEASNKIEYRFLNFTGYEKNGTIILDTNKVQSIDASKIRDLYFFPLEDYNRIFGLNETLSEGEVIVCADRIDYQNEMLEIDGLPEMKVKSAEKNVIPVHNAQVSLVSSYYIIVPETEQMAQIAKTVQASLPEKIYKNNPLQISEYYAFDTSLTPEEQISLTNELSNGLGEKFEETGLRVHSLADSRQDSYEMNGSFFFLGIFLGLIFLSATVLMMYYKQLSEGYEDCARFEIMQKVGMTKKEIRKSINSQVLTVFFLPLITAGIHTAFAFPIVLKLLQLFGLTNTVLLILATLSAFLVFGLFYIIVYRITSGAYYKIVSGKKERI